MTDREEPDENKPSVDDPHWVDEIMARALERAENDQAAARARPDQTTPRVPDVEPIVPAPAPRPDDASPTPELPLTGPDEGDHTVGHDVDIDDHEPLDPDDLDEPPQKRGGKGLRAAIEWTAVIVGALVVALVIKTFLLQAFYIPSESMEPTLVKGDRVLVNKLSYDLHDVNRGDVIVFKKPEGTAGDIDDLIKRVIALPNETLELRDGRVYIDGMLLEEPYLTEGTQTRPLRVIPGCVGEASDARCVVPDGTVLVMGDNRTNSTDGRAFGPIDIDSVVGRAFVKVYPFDDIGLL